MIFLQVLALIYLAKSVICDFSDGFTLEKLNGCEKDGWESLYTKLDRCIGYFEDFGTQTYKTGDKKCQEITHSLPGSKDKKETFGYPVIINNEKDQRFVKLFLQSRKIKQNIWLGLRKCKESTGICAEDFFTPVTYNNWVNKSHNPVDYCVQMIAHGANFGKWQKVSCDTKGLVVCEKRVIWSWEKLQIIVRRLVVDINYILRPKA